MTTWWVDPFLEATTQGNGTTNTAAENGTYAAPFSISRLRSTSSTPLSSLNSITINDNDEIRIKGLPFSTLFESKGNVYSYSSSAYNSVSPLRPVSGNSTFDATIADNFSSIFAFQNSDISSFFPNWSHPAFFAAYYTSNSTELDAPISPFIYGVIEQQLGYGDSSDTGIEVFRLKNTYANVWNSSGTRYYWMTMANKVKITAGWTSETAQEGYSILEHFNTTTYDYAYYNNSTLSGTHFDCERLVICYAARSSAGIQNNHYFRCDNSRSVRGAATAHVAPMFVSANGRQNYYYTPYYYSGDSVVYPWIAGDDDSRYGSMYIYNSTGGNSRSVTFKNIIISGYVYISNNNLSCTTSFGNLYHFSNDASGVNRPFYHTTSTSSGRGGSYKFLQDSVYFLVSDSTNNDNILAPDPAILSYGGSTGTVTYESGLKKPGIAPLDNLATSTTYGPTSAGATEGEPLFSATREISTNNDWFVPQLGRSANNNPIEYCQLGKLICNGNDFRTTAHNLVIKTDSAVGALVAPNYVIWSAEHNDYDGIPISLIGNPHVGGETYAALMYNDTVNATNVLVAQWSGTPSTSTQVWLPLELSVPSYTAGSDNLRVTVSMAYSDGASNTAGQTASLRIWHRDTTQSGNYRVYSSSNKSIPAGGDPASPTTHTLNLSNVPTSGQENITSVIVAIGLLFTSNTNIQKYYITNAAIETY